MRRLVPLMLLLGAGCFEPVGQPQRDAGTRGAVPCGGRCLDDEVCLDDVCQKRTCDNVRCLSGSSCVRGRCYPLECGGAACPSGLVCDGRRCVEPACAGVTCTFGSCVDGGCPSCSQLEYFDLDAGRCALRNPTGVPCGTGAACSTGFCVGGVCCDSLCNEDCETCETGSCTLRPALDPGFPHECYPGRCNGRTRTCAVSCGGDPECAATAFCNSSKVCTVDVANGAACLRDSQCMSGHCNAGVCCDQACNGFCMSCQAMPSPDGGVYSAGTCHPVPQNYIFGNCLPYLCSQSTIGCPGKCDDDQHCWGSLFCDETAPDGGQCVPFLTQGVACTRNGQCSTGNCRNGVCCEAGCTGGCKDCKANGTCLTRSDGPVDGGCGGSGFCRTGQCCDQSCQGPCERCSLPGLEGSCTAVSGPAYACNGVYACQPNGTCTTSCTPGSGCSFDGYCNPATHACETPCDPFECAQQGNKCCINNVCIAPPKNLFCEF